MAGGPACAQAKGAVEARLLAEPVAIATVVRCGVASRLMPIPLVLQEYHSELDDRRVQGLVHRGIGLQSAGKNKSQTGEQCKAHFWSVN